MSFVNRGGEEQQRETGSGAPPLDWEPDDPDTVKVHYDVSGWTIDQRAELTETLADAGLPHAWEGDELVVPEAAESAADALFDTLEQRIGPFAVGLGPDEPATEFGLDEWPASDREVLEEALVDAQIPRRWSGSTVFVATDAEDVVDDLLDAIERGDLVSFDDDDEAVPDGALGELYVIGDRLGRDPADGGARAQLLALVPMLHAARPPFGVAVRPWGRVVETAQAVATAFTDAEHDPAVIADRARELRTIIRPFV